MGGIVSSLGLGGGGDTGEAGTKFAASGANFQMPVTVDDAHGMEVQAQQALNQQQAFATALAAQNGITNQSNIFNQLGGIANGTGPNPAMAALNQATGANTANQAALMAGQRGAGANTGLIARQAAQQGAANQQAAVGQGATMQAQQAMNALNMQGGLATQQVGQQAAANQAMLSGTQNEQANLLGAIAAQNGAQGAMSANRNSTNAGIANTVAQGQQALGGNVMGAVGSVIALAKGGEVRNYYPDGGVVEQPTISTVPTPTLSSQASDINKNNQSAVSKVAQYFKNQDNSNPSMIGGSSNPGAQSIAQGGKQLMNALGSAAGKGIKSLFSSDSTAGIDPSTGAQAGAGTFGPQTQAASEDDAALESMAAEGFARGGKVPAMVSPGEMYLPPKKAQAVAVKKANPMSGERIPGKAKVKGDSLKNDTVPKTLEAGGVVIPRSIMESKDAAKKAAAFVAAHLAKSGHMPKRPK